MTSTRARVRRAVRMLPPAPRHRLAAVARSPRLRRVLRPVRWGNLRRVAPLSRRYGFDRGTPVDRIFLAEFFATYASDIRGRVLEVDRPQFTDRYGSASGIEVLDVDGRNDAATILADLADPAALPESEFDCIVLPQTLQYVADPAEALTNLWRALRPGGVLLLTVPVTAKVDHHATDVDRWRFAPRGLERLLAARCPGADTVVRSYGDALTGAAFLLGAAAEDLRPADLRRHDPEFPVLVGARVVRPAAP